MKKRRLRCVVGTCGFRGWSTTETPIAVNGAPASAGRSWVAEAGRPAPATSEKLTPPCSMRAPSFSTRDSPPPPPGPLPAVAAEACRAVGALDRPRRGPPAVRPATRARRRGQSRVRLLGGRILGGRLFRGAVSSSSAAFGFAAFAGFAAGAAAASAAAAFLRERGALAGVPSAAPPRARRPSRAGRSGPCARARPRAAPGIPRASARRARDPSAPCAFFLRSVT